MKLSRYRLPFLIAIFIHFFVALIFLSMNFQSKNQFDNQVLNAELKFNFPTNEKTFKKPIQKSTIKKKLASKQIESLPSNPQTLASNSPQQKIDPFLIFLSNKIAKQQEFLEKCSTDGDTNKARVSFVLLPSGAIQNIKIITPSYYPVCNELAKQAIAMIEPVDEAKRYIHVPKTFEIDIYFSA